MNAGVPMTYPMAVPWPVWISRLSARGGRLIAVRVLEALTSGDAEVEPLHFGLANHNQILGLLDVSVQYAASVCRRRADALFCLNEFRVGLRPRKPQTFLSDWPSRDTSRAGVMPWLGKVIIGESRTKKNPLLGGLHRSPFAVTTGQAGAMPLSRTRDLRSNSSNGQELPNAIHIPMTCDVTSVTPRLPGIAAAW